MEAVVALGLFLLAKLALLLLLLSVRLPRIGGDADVLEGMFVEVVTHLSLLLLLLFITLALLVDRFRGGGGGGGCFGRGSRC